MANEKTVMIKFSVSQPLKKLLTDISQIPCQDGKRYKLIGCILHSERGSQDTSETFRDALSKAGVKQSLSGVNHCYDNSRYICGVLTLPVTVASLFLLIGKDEDAVGTGGAIIERVQFIPLIVSIFSTEIALRKNFDKIGTHDKSRFVCRIIK